MLAIYSCHAFCKHVNMLTFAAAGLSFGFCSPIQRLNVCRPHPSMSSLVFVSHNDSVLQSSCRILFESLNLTALAFTSNLLTLFTNSLNEMYFLRLVNPDCSMSAFQIKMSSSISRLLNFEEVGATS